MFYIYTYIYIIYIQALPDVVEPVVSGFAATPHRYNAGCATTKITIQ